MELTEAVPGGSRVVLDTAPFIYFFEEHPVFGPLVAPVFEMISEGRVFGHVSVITLLEVVITPMRQGRTDLVTRYRDVLTGARNLALVPVDPALAERAAALRAAHNLRTPDAIIAATALETGCGYLITNDRRFKAVREIEVLVLSDFAAN